MVRIEETVTHHVLHYTHQGSIICLLLSALTVSARVSHVVTDSYDCCYCLFSWGEPLLIGIATRNFCYSSC